MTIILVVDLKEMIFFSRKDEWKQKAKFILLSIRKRLSKSQEI